MENLLSICITLVILLLLVNAGASDERKGNPKIAIIGAGIGGTSSAYYLRKLFGNDLEIDLYEAKEVGGRLDITDIGKKQYDSGGTVIHPKNMYMVNFTKLLGMEHQELTGGSFAIYDGHNIIFDSSSFSWLVTAQLLWRYGWDIVRLQNFVSGMLKDFERIYEHQAAGLAFTRPEKLLESMSPDFLTYLQQSTEETLKNAGMGPKIIEEVAMMALRTNYGQTTSAQGFVGSVSVAGIEPGLWRIGGGNKHLPEKLLKKANAKLIKAKVTNVILEEATPPKYTVISTEGSKNYDIVIVATPLHDKISDISFENFPNKITDFPQHFHRTVATFVKGQPNFPKFGYSTLHDFPTELLTVKEIFFNSVGKQTPVHISKTYKEKQELPVWKVFSQVPLTDKELDELFLSYEVRKDVDWLAYPHYESSETDLPPFVLHPQLYYVNAIEICASAMEMSVIGARNAALLAYNNWKGQLSNIDPNFDNKNSKEEL